MVFSNIPSNLNHPRGHPAVAIGVVRRISALSLQFGYVGTVCLGWWSVDGHVDGRGVSSRIQSEWKLREKYWCNKNGRETEECQARSVGNAIRRERSGGKLKIMNLAHVCNMHVVCKKLLHFCGLGFELHKNAHHDIGCSECRWVLRKSIALARLKTFVTATKTNSVLIKSIMCRIITSAGTLYFNLKKAFNGQGLTNKCYRMTKYFTSFRRITKCGGIFNAWEYWVNIKTLKLL